MAPTMSARCRSTPIPAVSMIVSAFVVIAAPALVRC
jgi:hypothetical protein